MVFVMPPWPNTSVRLTDVIGKTDQRIVVPRRSPFVGHVVDAATGEPIEQFTVRLDSARRHERDDLRAEGILVTVTDPGTLFDTEDGVFRVGHFAPGTALFVAVEAKGYVTAEIDRVVVNPGAEPVTIRMRK